MAQIRNSELVDLLSADFVLNTGELHLSSIAVNAAYSAASESVILVTVGAGVTVTLPPATTNTGKTYAIKRLDAGAGVLTVDTVDAGLIDGAATYTGLNTQYEAIIIVCDGTNWHIISAT